jgi:aspartate/methionine/tyrosine aminotransferase
MLLTFAAILNPGDEVILTNPCYACYEKFITAFGGRAISVPVGEKDSFQYTEQSLTQALSDRTKAILFNSPSNPTGTLISAEQLAGVMQLLPDRVIAVSDEIYHGLVYEGRAHSVREFSQNAIVINGFSKLFAMTGWRLGYAIVPHALIRAVQKLQQNLLISAPDFAQMAAITALRDALEDVERMRLEYDRRRRFVLRRLDEIGLAVQAKPTGAFYVFVNVKQYTADVYSLAFRILDEAGVAVTPGVDFGTNGEGFIRICYANSMDNLEEGMNRLSKFFQKLEPASRDRERA